MYVYTCIFILFNKTKKKGKAEQTKSTKIIEHHLKKRLVFCSMSFFSWSSPLHVFCESSSLVRMSNGSIKSLWTSEASG